MSKSTATRARPLSPHLTAYRWPITMTTSILHRVTGVGLYIGTALIAWWLLAAATSEAQFDMASWFFGSWFGMLVLFGYTWALLNHLIGGIRHLVWDTGAGLEKRVASKIAWASVSASIVLTVLVWIVGFMARGAF